jgi:hypothetical protein
MTALTAFYDYVLPDLPRCNEAIALLHIRLACEEFYRRSMVKRATLADITTAADTAEYALTLPDGYVAHKALHVWLDGLEIQPIGMDDRDGINANWKTETGQPDRHYLPDTANVGLFLTPSGVYTVSVEAVLKPKSDATAIDDWVFETYREGIAAGAKYRLMAMPKKPWSSEMAAMHKGEFDRCVDTAMLAADRGHGRAPKRTRSVFGLR